MPVTPTRVRPSLVATAVLLLVAACGSSHPSSSATAGRAAGQASSLASAPGTAKATSPRAGAPAATATGSPAAGAATAAPYAPSPAQGASPQRAGGTAPGGHVATPAPATAPGHYTYDVAGTVTVGSPGTPQRADGTATLTVEPADGDRQRSTLHDDNGDTTEELVVRSTGTYAADLHLATKAFDKDFRPTSPVLLVPSPARPGTSWSWSATSTDGKTQLHATSQVLRTESVTVEGRQVPTAVIDSTLTLSGDVDFTDELTTWYAAGPRLVAKEHSKGKGSYSGFPFSFDSTRTLRSTRPA